METSSPITGRSGLPGAGLHRAMAATARNMVTRPARLVTTFDQPYLAYRLHADTLSYAVTLSPALGPNTALVFTGELSVTENESVRYVNHLINAGVTHRF